MSDWLVVMHAYLYYFLLLLYCTHVNTKKKHISNSTNYINQEMRARKSKSQNYRKTEIQTSAR